jgi:hypothetical protein
MVTIHQFKTEWHHGPYESKRKLNQTPKTSTLEYALLD